MEIFLNIFLLILGFLFIFKRQSSYESYVNHLTIFGFVWPLIIVGAQLSYPNVIPIEVVFFYYLCWYTYIFGSSILKHKTSSSENVLMSFRKIKMLILLLVLFCFISNYELLSLILSSGNILAWAALRKENGFEELESNIFFTLFQRAYLVYIPLGIYLLSKNKITKTYLIILIITGLLFSVLRFTRAPILNLLIVILVSYVYIYRKKLPFFSILLVVVFVLMIFAGSMMVLMQNTYKHNVFDDVKLYLFGGQVSYLDFYYDKYIDNVRYDSGYFSLDWLNYILKKIGIIESYPSYVRDYTDRIEVLTNTYTYLDAFTYDFGLIGAVFGSFTLGLFSDYSYNIYVKRRNVFALIFYGYICYYNCFVFANNEFVRFSVVLTIISLIFYNFLVRKTHNAK